MRKVLTCWLVMGVCTAQSQTINVRGVVTNKAGKTVGNAIVTLKTAGLKDTTASDGAYVLASGNVSVTPSLHRIDGISLDRGGLVVSLDNPSSIKVEQFDMAGSLLKDDQLPSAGIGKYRFPLASARKAGLVLVRVTTDNQVASLRCLSFGSREAILIDATAARAAAVVDTLVTTATGYTTNKLAIATYDQAANIVLDTSSSTTPSAGCGKAPTLKNGTLTIQSSGKSRKYILRIPDSYDNKTPYRLVFAYAESGSSAQSVATRSYFRMAGYDPKGTIFVAPDAENGAGSWSKTDVTFTDDILAQLQGDLCVDKTRIFATGFSFGGAMSIAIACTRADVFRGVAFFSGADLTNSCPTTLTKPIAYYASQASGDASGTPIPTSGRIKQAQFAAINGCTAEANSTTFPASGKAHTCTVYKNCKAGYPTVYCVFDGPHGWEPNDPGQSTSWNPPEAWKFITQF